MHTYLITDEHLYNAVEVICMAIKPQLRPNTVPQPRHNPHNPNPTPPSRFHNPIPLEQVLV